MTPEPRPALARPAPRPFTIAIVGWTFVVFGAAALAGGVWSFASGTATPRLIELSVASIVRALAIVGGAYLLTGRAWARALLLAWLGYHVVLSVWHSTAELVVHVVLFTAVAFALTRRAASLYLRDEEVT